MLAFLFVVLFGVGVHAFDRLSQVSHVQALSARHAFGAFAAEPFEFVLDGGDLAAQPGGVGGGDQIFDARPGGVVDVAPAAVGAAGRIVFQYARPRGAGPVVDGPPAPVAPLLDTGRLSRRGEQVQQQVGLRPQPVGQVALLLGVVAPVERELAHDVVVPGFDGGLVVLPVRSAPGLFDVLVLEPVDELVVDGLGAVVGVEAGDGEREQGDRQVDGLPDGICRPCRLSFRASCSSQSPLLREAARSRL